MSSIKNDSFAVVHTDGWTVAEMGTWVTGVVMESKIDLTGLVDINRVIEVERIDTAALPDRRGYLFVKRVADVTLSLVAQAVLALPMAVIALAVKLDSPGPVFYRQERLGKNGKPFKLVKFRSMRTCRLDELPQFFCGGGEKRGT